MNTYFPIQVIYYWVESPCSLSVQEWYPVRICRAVALSPLKPLLKPASVMMPAKTLEGSKALPILTDSYLLHQSSLTCFFTFCLLTPSLQSSNGFRPSESHRTHDGLHRAQDILLLMVLLKPMCIEVLILILSLNIFVSEGKVLQIWSTQICQLPPLLIRLTIPHVFMYLFI